MWSPSGTKERSRLLPRLSGGVGRSVCLSVCVCVCCMHVLITPDARANPTSPLWTKKGVAGTRSSRSNQHIHAPQTSAKRTTPVKSSILMSFVPLPSVCLHSPHCLCLVSTTSRRLHFGCIHRSIHPLTHRQKSLLLEMQGHRSAGRQASTLVAGAEKGPRVCKSGRSTTRYNNHSFHSPQTNATHNRQTVTHRIASHCIHWSSLPPALNHHHQHDTQQTRTRTGRRERVSQATSEH